MTTITTRDAEGDDVHAVVDASGDMRPMASQTTLARLVQAVVVPITGRLRAGEPVGTTRRTLTP